jgi:hypothetical protein
VAAAIIRSSSAIIGTRKPNRSMLAAIWLICLSEWVRALRGLGLRDEVGSVSTRGLVFELHVKCSG